MQFSWDWIRETKLVVAVISADAYPFFGFFRPNWSSWGYRNRCFLVALCLDNKMTELGSSDQEVSASAGKNTRVVLVRCCAWKFIRAAILFYFFFLFLFMFFITSHLQHKLKVSVQMGFWTKEKSNLLEKKKTNKK